MAGDPYAFSRIEKGQFTISMLGRLARSGWADDFTFRYAPDSKTWLLDKVVRELTDTQSEQHKQLELTAKDFGQVAFADFDPAKLPKVAPTGRGRTRQELKGSNGFRGHGWSVHHVAEK